MKKIFLILLFALVPMLSSAQELKWYNNLEEAMKVSDKTKKPLMLFFTGSDWCGWCKRLESEVLNTPEFSAWAKDNVVLVEVDFPRRTPQPDDIKMQNAQLQQFFGVRGYPTVWFVNAAKNKENKISFSQLGSTGYVAGGPSVWLDGANKILKKV